MALAGCVCVGDADICDDCCKNNRGATMMAQAYNVIKAMDPVGVLATRFASALCFAAVYTFKFAARERGKTNRGWM